MDPAIAVTACLFTAGLFLASAGHKLSDLRRFAATVAAYRLAPASLAMPLALTAVATELAIAVLVLSFQPNWQAAGLGIAIGLLLAYAAAIGFNIARGNDRIDCGCLGFAARVPRLTTDLVLRNLVLAGLAAVALLPRAARPLGWLDATSIAGSLAVLALLYAGFALAFALPKKETFA